MRSIAKREKLQLLGCMSKIIDKAANNNPTPQQPPPPPRVPTHRRTEDETTNGKNIKRSVYASLQLCHRLSHGAGFELRETDTDEIKERRE